MEELRVPFAQQFYVEQPFNASNLSNVRIILISRRTASEDSLKQALQVRGELSWSASRQAEDAEEHSCPVRLNRRRLEKDRTCPDWIETPGFA
jgi:hypothetical protein